MAFIFLDQPIKAYCLCGYVFTIQSYNGEYDNCPKCNKRIYLNKKLGKPIKD